MSKLSQLDQIRKHGLPTPRYIAVSYKSFLEDEWHMDGLSFPVAVRSTYGEEDGEEKSYAGHFETLLNVEKPDLREAIAAVFESYPEKEGTAVIVQEMVEAGHSGVLFAFRRYVWKLELVEGSGDNLVSGKKDPQMFLLPKFVRADVQLYPFYRFWTGTGNHQLDGALVKLSYSAGLLLEKMDARYGLDIEFSIVNGKLYILQARPVTTPEEGEEVLTSANHKEILPPRPSRLMTSLIVDCGKDLFDYYRRLDPTLGPRSFLEASAGMPWINLSGLLDMMVHWGLPTGLVSKSVGAQDVYRVGLRPWRILLRVVVFVKAFAGQLTSVVSIRKWLEQTKRQTWQQRQQRAVLWEEDPGEAFKQWVSGFQEVYVGLVNRMQALTGAMSGPVILLYRFGLLRKLTNGLGRESKTTDYLRAFHKLRAGQLRLEEFINRFGHRGFYESDLGQPRFCEYPPEKWPELLGESRIVAQNGGPVNGKKPWWSFLMTPVIHLIHTREWIRHETMKIFFEFRMELMQAGKNLISTPDIWHLPHTDLYRVFSGEEQIEELADAKYPPQSGWDMDTFLSNRHGRRLPVTILNNILGSEQDRKGIGIFPGTVKGQVWRVYQAGFEDLQRPDFETVVLVADALDPGWMPYFSQVDGVVSYVGGLLSHASIVLREAGIPSVTSIPRSIELQTGDWVEIDGQTGKVWKIES